MFQSTRPVRGATTYTHTPHTPTVCFNPRAPCGARQQAFLAPLCASLFQSTRPVRGATGRIHWVERREEFQSTRPVRGATCVRRTCPPYSWFQSTRPVRGATTVDGIGTGRIKFQSTRPVRGATQRTESPHCGTEFQSTRPVRGATALEKLETRLLEVSIHAPRAGRDCCVDVFSYMRLCFNPRAPCGARQEEDEEDTDVYTFQSTRPVRGATIGNRGRKLITVVSIHAPRAGRDSHARKSRSHPGSFNPRAPCGARRVRWSL